MISLLITGGMLRSLPTASAPGGSTAGAGPHLISCGGTIECPSIVLARAVEATPATATAAISVGNAIFMEDLLCGPLCSQRDDGLSHAISTARANSLWPWMSPCQPVYQRCATLLRQPTVR